MQRPGRGVTKTVHRQKSARTTSSRFLRLRLALEVEFDFRRCVGPSRRGEVRPRRVAEHSSEDNGGKTLDGRVVGLHRFVETTSFHRNSILGAFKLRL